MLLRRHYERIYALCRRLAGNDDDADTGDDTGANLAVTKEMLADEKTVEMPASKSDKKTG